MSQHTLSWILLLSSEFCIRNWGLGVSLPEVTQGGRGWSWLCSPGDSFQGLCSAPDCLWRECLEKQVSLVYRPAQCSLGFTDLPDREDPLEEGMAGHSTILAWRIPWTEEPGSDSSLSIRLQRVRHDWSNSACMQAPCCLYLRLRRPTCTFLEPHWSSGCFWNMPKPSHTSWFLLQIKGICYQGATNNKRCDWSYFWHEHCILLYFWLF